MWSRSWRRPDSGSDTTGIRSAGRLPRVHLLRGRGTPRPYIGEITRSGDHRGELLAEALTQPGRRLDQRVQVDAGRDPHPVQKIDQVLGGDVAGRPWREGTAPGSSDRRGKGGSPG